MKRFLHNTVLFVCLLIMAQWACPFPVRGAALSEVRTRGQETGTAKSNTRSRSEATEYEYPEEREDARRKRVSRLEYKGDKLFVTSRYDRATELYERAARRAASRDRSEWLRMELKLARVYNMLQDPENTTKHYAMVYEGQDSLLSVDDACIYINALRVLERNQEAEVIARHYAFRHPYQRNQRFLNTLHALSNQQHYYGKGESDYAVQLLTGGPLSEYWISHWGGRLFCAASGSRMLDPRKVFFHRTEYFAIGSEGELTHMRDLPREVQNGAATTAGNLRVVTGINYRGSDRIHGVDVQELFRTQLLYTVYNPKRKGWSALQPLFEHQEEACYAHPVLLDDGRTLLFVSDMEGGYGGMDLYITSWNDELQSWNAPVNLGSTVNTEGDEIFPSVDGNELYFSSNGHEGYGGYDIYRANFVDGKVLSNSLWHIPYPINSVNNDYGLYVVNEQGYFISDRRGLDFRDDIYAFGNARTSISGMEAIGLSQEYLALNGALTQVEELQRNGSQTTDGRLIESAVRVQPEEGDVLLSIYYGFDRWDFDQDTYEKLRALASDALIEQLSEIIVVGYADEMGSEAYNQRLSERRASTVAKQLSRYGIQPAITWEGRGRTAPDAEDYREQMEERRKETLHTWNPDMPVFELPLQDRIALNRTARRVDIIVRKK